MPNLTFYIAAEHMPSDRNLALLSRDCVELCTRVLHAAKDKVHIMYVEVRPGHGHPVFAELLYRVELYRTPAVMQAFMEGLDNAIVRHTGLTARIRCFASHAIDARH
ncbi:hypothetical protein ACL9RI_24625 [Janthinobacterium sp. Mn2066]|uniref:hypothetical protein n=1 Tax=Janthinobacterium sp. Mn2066 TaxID=3395264 RepID=UPI003BE9DF0B